MEAQEWNMVTEILARSTGFSYVQTAPLIEKLTKQLQDKAQKRGVRQMGEVA